jgi:multicomponent Na+:H+ antiporter subunit E
MSRLFVNVSPVETLSAFVFWLAVYAVLWYLLTNGTGWAFGIPTIVLASLLAIVLRVRPWCFQLRKLPAFLLFFLHAALGGAVDVARRALHIRCPIAPTWVHYRFTVSDSRVRLLVSACLGLFPGTLASKVESDELHVHVLDETLDWQASVAALERQLNELISPCSSRAGKA